jgi:peptidyl-prolyl cis-trans isomerase D
VAPVWLKRTARDATIPAEAIQAAFALPPAPEGQLASKALALSDGNEALVVVKAIKDGDPTAISEQDKVALSAEIQQAQAQQTLGVLLKALRDEAKITINQKSEKTATP